MLQRSTIVSAAIVAASIIFGTAPASAAVSVTCTGGNQLSAAINAARATAKPGDTLEFQVSGNCVDNLLIPLGLRIYLTGVGGGATDGYGASLEAASTSEIALNVAGGWATVNNFYIQAKSGSTADDAAETSQSGYLRIINSKVVANGAMNAVGTYASALAIGNSVITGDKEGAVAVAYKGNLWLFAENGKATSITYTGSQGGQAIGCQFGSIGGQTSGTGTITIGPSTGNGMGTRGCDAALGIGSPKGSIRITRASNIGVLSKAGGTINLVGVAVSNNTNTGIETSAGVVELDNSTISKPSATAVGLSARRGGVIFFNNLYGPTTVSWTGTNTNFYNCRQGGKVYGSSSNPTGGAATSGCLVKSDTVTK